jgi:hypothetical protein
LQDNLKLVTFRAAEIQLFDLKAESGQISTVGHVQAFLAGLHDAAGVIKAPFTH